MSRRERYKPKNNGFEKTIKEHHFCLNNDTCDGDLALGHDDLDLFTVVPYEQKHTLKDFVRRVHSTNEKSINCSQKMVLEKYGR